jgi:DNA-binding NtrC family response regulator
MQRLLVVEDDSAVRTTIVTFLEAEGYTVDAVSSTVEALDRLKQEIYPIVISDIYIDDRTGLDVLEAARHKDPQCAVILMTARGSMETVMAATRGGAFDYIAKPFDLDRMLETLKRAEASRQDQEEEAGPEDLPESEMIGSSPAMIEIYKTASHVAPTDATVLIEGETGTGKELVARMIHRFSTRTGHPFVPVDCASIAPTLLESELFGVMRGAYTGADRDRSGVFEAANHGTVFLDEVGEIEHNFQLKLLRFLQEMEIRPVGSPRARRVDVRVIAATNRDLQRMVDEDRFREDLWFRLNVVRIVIPPLRERRADIPLMARNHHERMDGNGYPDGLKGDQIPPGARIVTLADSFDAMTTDRPYRKKLPLEDVLQDFRANTGTQFDPEVVCAFCRAFLNEIEGKKERRLLNMLNRNYSNIEQLSPLLNTMLSEFNGSSTTAATTH